MPLRPAFSSVSVYPPRSRKLALLKRDIFGTVSLIEESDGSRCVVRDLSHARSGLAWLARHLARRESRALVRLAGTPGVPRFLHADRRSLAREWIEGEPMQGARPRDARYFREAFRLVCRLHRRLVVHNDLAKEPNWLVIRAGTPAIVDFQLAYTARSRGRLFRALAYDDLRHLLKHKRTYLPDRLTARERRILARPSMVSRFWMASGKRVYLYVTRKWFRWSDREGAGDRQLPS